MSHLPPPYPLIKKDLESGMTIPFLGAGASVSATAPCPAWEMCLDNSANNGGPGCYLPPAKCVGIDPALPSPASLPRVGELACYLARETLFPTDETPDLTKVAQYYDVVAGRTKLDRELHKIFAKHYPFTSLHSRLAKVEAPLLIVTTNYDDLIEKAFRAEGRPHDVVIHTTDPLQGNHILWWAHGSVQPEQVLPNKLNIDISKTTVIYKMHGAVDRDDPNRDQYVITEDDYIDFLTRMTRSKVIPSIFAEPFQTRSFLFLGYGLRDWNLRVVLKRIEKDMRRTKSLVSWAVQHNPSALERRFWQNRNVNVYDMKIEEFVSNL